MTGLEALLRKELLEAWRTKRLPAVAGLFLIVGILSPLTARYLPEILKLALGSQLTVPIPAPTAGDAIVQLQKNLGQFGALASIVLAMSAVAGEKDRGTAAFILTKPASRGAFLAAKVIALGLVLFVATAIAVIVGWGYTAILFEPQPFGGWVVLVELAWLSLTVWGAVTFLASTVTGSAAVAAGVGFIALIGLSIVAAIPQLGRFLPSGLDEPARLLALGRVDAVDLGTLATAIGGSIALLVVALGLAWLSFRRQEL